MVDEVARFIVAQSVDPLKIESAQRTILTLWETIFTAFPNTLVFDDGSQFRDVFVEICEIHDVVWQRSNTRHYSALDIEERYQESIKRTFRKLLIDHPKLKKEFRIQFCRQSM